MYVLIDPSGREEFVFYHSTDLVNWSKVSFARSACSGLLTALVSLVEREGKNIAALEGVVVLVGKGSFTSDRIAITMVNMLVFSLSIRAATIDELDFSSVAGLFQTQAKPHYLVARYSGRPNVGAHEPYRD